MASGLRFVYGTGSKPKGVWNVEMPIVIRLSEQLIVEIIRDANVTVRAFLKAKR
jgi:hypothetical protein